jgi:hypothetical protein
MMLGDTRAAEFEIQAPGEDVSTIASPREIESHIPPCPWYLVAAAGY